MSGEHDRWANLLPEILRSIRERLSWKDYFSFRLTCRDWNFSTELDHGIYKKVKYPFLLHYPKVAKSTDDHSSPSVASSCCRAYSPAYGKTYYMRAPNEVSDACISCAAYGWLLFSGEFRIFFYRPSTGDIIQLPYYGPNLRGSFNRMSFSAPPTSPDCVVVGQVDLISEKETLILFIRRGQSCWNHDLGHVPNRMRLKNRRPRKLTTGDVRKMRVKSSVCSWSAANKFRRCVGDFFWPHYNSSPLFHRGAFYCLAQDGRLGVLNPKAKSKDKIWRVLDTSAADVFRDAKENEAYLVHCKGELLAVVVGPMGRFVRIVKFYEPTRAWRIVHDLENHVVLLSPAGCVAMECDEAAGLRRNTVHLPRFSGRNHHHVFYSLSTRRFHCFNEEDRTLDNLYDTKLPLVHAWMTPTFPFPCPRRKWDWSLKLKGRRRAMAKNIAGPKHRMIHPHYLVRNLSFTQPPPSHDDDEQYSIPLQRPKQSEAAPMARPCLVLRSGEGEARLIDLSSGKGGQLMEQLALRIGSKKVYSSGHGHLLVLIDNKARSCSLLYPSSMVEIPLPTWETPFSSYDDDGEEDLAVHVPRGESKLVVMVFGRMDDEQAGEDGVNKGKDVAMVWRDGDEKWTLHTRPSKLRVDAIHGGTVAHQGKIYGYVYDPWGKDDLAVVELRTGGYGIESTGATAPQFFSPGFCGDWRRLVESCGELLHIATYYAGDGLGKGCSGGTFIDAKVFKMDFSVMEWRVVEDVGDRAFLLGEWGCYACCASKSGLRRNSFYFTESNINLCVYDYGNRTISSSLLGPDVDDSWVACGFVMLYD
ncbi:unnamed protein product [Linum trigynum]|uniref:KIB1-4 beta-propeller domain-containing protein n=1 Tax=Linum trigynum TaxID=586398 RepID=A0AAV2C7S4_9ROSI